MYLSRHLVFPLIRVKESASPPVCSGQNCRRMRAYGCIATLHVGGKVIIFSGSAQRIYLVFFSEYKKIAYLCNKLAPDRGSQRNLKQTNERSTPAVLT